MPIRIKLPSYDDVKVLEKSTVEVPVVHFQAAVTFLELVNADFDTLHDGGLNITHRDESFKGCCDDTIGVEHNKACDGLGIEQAREKIHDQNARRDAEYSTLCIHLFSCTNALGICIDDRQATRLGRHADGRMLGQCFSNPTIFSIISADYYNQVVASRVVGVEEIVDKAH
ncbi:hypothetical protein HG531_005167 [Fusarium graminearum]|nr:hypothetical protein HG531_005167 [Fusarium graminearum]